MNIFFLKKVIFGYKEMHNFMLITKKETSPAHIGRRKNSTGGNTMGSLMSVRNDDLVREVQYRWG